MTKISNVQLILKYITPLCLPCLAICFHVFMCTCVYVNLEMDLYLGPPKNYS
jgi:hypothetical protein